MLSALPVWQIFNTKFIYPPETEVLKVALKKTDVNLFLAGFKHSEPMCVVLSAAAAAGTYAPVG
jgi:RNA-binding protein YlmH